MAVGAGQERIASDTLALEPPLVTQNAGTLAELRRRLEILDPEEQTDEYLLVLEKIRTLEGLLAESGVLQEL